MSTGERALIFRNRTSHTWLMAAAGCVRCAKYGSVLIHFVSCEDYNTGLASFTFNNSKILHKSWKGPKY